MIRLRVLAELVAVSLTAGCMAQSTIPVDADPVLNRRIEIQVRAQYSLPADVEVTLGPRKPSNFAGYETLPVTLSQGEKKSVVSFLISTDNTKLIHQETLDLTKDPAAALNIEGRPIRGNPNAKVTVVNFDDLECPFCARMHSELFPETVDHYKGLIRFVYKDDPLTEIHPWAMHAAVDANCIAAQSGEVYWTYVDYLHSHGQEVTGDQHDLAKSNAALDRIARNEGVLGKLDGNKLDACLAKQDETQVRASVKEADDLGLDGTPAVFVNGERVNGGAVPTEQLWAVIDRAIRAAGLQPPPEPAPAAAAAAPSGTAQEGK